MHGLLTYTLSIRALRAAHRVSLTEGTPYTCSLCSDSSVHDTKSGRTGKKTKTSKTNTKFQRWQVFNRFNQMIPSPAPRVLRTLNPVERLLVARSALMMTIHNRLHDTKRKQSRSTGHGCIIQMDQAAQIQSIRHKLPRNRDDINAWEVVREDGENKPYKVPINIDNVLAALDWLIENNQLYEDLRYTNGAWRNEAAIADYRREASFTVPQHKVPKTEEKHDRWQASEKAQERANDIELGREQPGLEDNERNVPTLTPSFDVGEGDFIRYADGVEDDTARCPYNAGSACMDPARCLCRQVYKGVPNQP